MRSREPVRVSEALVNVWLDIEAAYCRAHGLPLNVEETEDEETEESAPRLNRNRDPPNEALRVIEATIQN